MNKEQQAEALAALREQLTDGARIYSILRQVSRSGMSRRYDFFTITPEGWPRWLSGRIAAALGYRQDKRTGAVIVGGCGFDGAYHVAEHVARATGVPVALERL